MNFKTTIVLVVLLVVAGIALLFTRDKGGGADDEKTVQSQQKVVDVQASDVTKLAVTSNAAKKLTLEKSGSQWRLSEPVSAAAETFEVDSLVRAITELQSTSIVK